MVGWCRLGGILSKWSSTLFLSSTALCSIYFQGDLWTWLFDWQVGDTSYNTDVDKSTPSQLYCMCILFCTHGVYYMFVRDYNPSIHWSIHPVVSQCLTIMRHVRIQLTYIWVFPKIGVPQNGWFMMEHPIKMDDLGVPLFLETPICYRL